MLDLPVLADHDWRKIQALQDFQQSLSAFTFFADVPASISLVERRRFRSYHDSAVISYCRPFTTSAGLPKLSLKQVGIRATGDEMDLHARLMEYRNKVVAHTDADRMRLLVTSWAIFEDDKYAIPHVVEDEGFEFLNDIPVIYEWLHKIMTALANLVFEKIQEYPPGTRHIRDYLATSSNE